MRIGEILIENVIDEAPLPADWDESQYSPGTTFKQRLTYTLARANKLGTGSSRIATTIEFQGRWTVLKIAKNRKGLAQNAVEAEILGDGYASQMGILIPLIDYDKQNAEPTWIQTELATKATESQLCKAMKCRSLMELAFMAESIAGKVSKNRSPDLILDSMRKSGYSEEDLETFKEYADKLAELYSSFNLELGDFSVKGNWGMYRGNPVIIDVGLNTAVLNKHYIKMKFKE